MTVQELYKKNPPTILPYFSVRATLRIMREKAMNSLIVTAEEGTLLGILSLHDIISYLVPHAIKDNKMLARAMNVDGYFESLVKIAGDTYVGEIMKKDCVSIAKDANIMELASELLRNDSTLVPVVEESKVIGVITSQEIHTALSSMM